MRHARSLTCRFHRHACALPARTRAHTRAQARTHAHAHAHVHTRTHTRRCLRMPRCAHCCGCAQVDGVDTEQTSAGSSKGSSNGPVQASSSSCCEQRVPVRAPSMAECSSSTRSPSTSPSKTRPSLCAAPPAAARVPRVAWARLHPLDAREGTKGCLWWSRGCSCVLVDGGAGEPQASVPLQLARID